MSITGYRVKNDRGQYVTAGWVYGSGITSVWTDERDGAPLVRAAVLDDTEAELLQLWQEENGVQTELEPVCL